MLLTIVELIGLSRQVKAAESYLSFSSFSRDGLIEQLEYDGFTHRAGCAAQRKMDIDAKKARCQ